MLQIFVVSFVFAVNVGEDALINNSHFELHNHLKQVKTYY